MGGRVLGQNRGAQRHRPKKIDGDRDLLGVMRKIVESFPRHGSERTHRVLTGPEAFGGWKGTIKRVHRICTCRCHSSSENTAECRERG